MRDRVHVDGVGGEYNVSRAPVPGRELVEYRVQAPWGNAVTAFPEDSDDVLTVRLAVWEMVERLRGLRMEPAPAQIFEVAT